VRRGDVTSAELLESVLQRIDERNSALNTVIVRLDEHAREEVRTRPGP
jgi:Asp-tRNA(Asn)/Glu-tRNA(Gln) amidotransferase A subunit family amidase